jgi:hypothetical protein
LAKSNFQTEKRFRRWRNQSSRRKTFSPVGESVFQAGKRFPVGETKLPDGKRFRRSANQSSRRKNVFAVVEINFHAEKRFRRPPNRSSKQKNVSTRDFVISHTGF